VGGRGGSISTNQKVKKGKSPDMVGGKEEKEKRKQAVVSMLGSREESFSARETANVKGVKKKGPSFGEGRTEGREGGRAPGEEFVPWHISLKDMEGKGWRALRNEEALNKKVWD